MMRLVRISRLCGDPLLLSLMDMPPELSQPELNLAVESCVMKTQVDPYYHGDVLT
jgi:hypothetical protein